MGSGLPGSLPSYLLYHLLLYISYLANKIVVVVVVVLGIFSLCTAIMPKDAISDILAVCGPIWML